MKILILGSGSFAGQTIFSDLLIKGFNVLGINRSEPKDEYFWPWIKDKKEKLNWHNLNINDNCDEIIEITNQFKPNIILDFMGQGMVAPSWKDPALWYNVNLLMKSKYLQSLLNLDSLEKYIRASTPEVYGSSEEFKIENSPFNPSTPYAVSHCAIDFHIRCLGQKDDFPYLIGRFANFYGVGQQLYRVIPRFILSCLTNKSFVLDGGGKSTRYFINSIDIINAYESLIKTSLTCHEFNFSGDEEVSISKLIDIICELSNSKRSKIVKYGPDRPGKDAHYRLNCKKAKDELNWEPSISLEEGLKQVYEWISVNIDKLSLYSWEYIHKR